MYDQTMPTVCEHDIKSLNIGFKKTYAELQDALLVSKRNIERRERQILELQNLNTYLSNKNKKMSRKLSKDERSAS